MNRLILHVDMDAFFAAVEELDRPELRGKAVIVGGTPRGHGVVATANYEARKYGVHSAMPAARAAKLCPDGVFVRPRMGRYSALSHTVMEVLGEFSPELEQISVDEAFLDITRSLRLANGPIDMARRIKKRIREATGGLTASVGLAPNKFLAKVASDLEKPDGLVVVEPGQELAFLAPLPIERIWGIGPRTAELLHSRGYYRIASLQNRSQAELAANFGEDFGTHVFRLANGQDDRPVVTEHERKSVSAETTLENFLAEDNRDAIASVLLALSEEVSERMRHESIWGQTLTLKVRDEKFRTRTRSRTLGEPIQLTDSIYRTALEIYEKRVHLDGLRVRLLGVGLSHLIVSRPRQLDLLDGPVEKRSQRVEKAVDAIRDRLGRTAITRGRLLGKKRR